MPARDVMDSAIAEHNRDVNARAFAAALMGVLTSLGLFIFIALAYFVFFFGRGRWMPVAAGTFILFFLIGLWSARRGVDPLKDVDPFSEDDLGAVKVAALGTGMITSPRHAIAGAASVVIHGPHCLVEAVRIRRTRIKPDSAMAESAADLLERLVATPSVPVASLEPKQAGALLVRLGLAKVEQPSGQPLSVRITGKGRDAVAAVRGRRA